MANDIVNDFQTTIHRRFPTMLNVSPPKKYERTWMLLEGILMHYMRKH